MIDKRGAGQKRFSRIHKKSSHNLLMVSIVTPVLNSANWIELCINSVLGQDYPNIEHIIIDGGSTDGTLEICQNYDHLVISSRKDRGQSHAINRGFAMARGDVFAWLCADDEYEPGAVSAAVRDIMAGHDLVTGHSRFVDAQGQVMFEHYGNALPFYDYDMIIRFWKYYTISQPATFWTRTMWEKCGPLSENLHFAMDYDLWLRMSKKCRFERIDAYTAKYRVHPEAKCFADNYSPRIELIKISKQNWPPKWRPGYWKLLLSYLFSNHPVTQHYSDGERLLAKTEDWLNKSERLTAILCFCKAHYKHFATPFLPQYKPILKRVLKEGIGFVWFWRLAGRAWYVIFGKSK